MRIIAGEAKGRRLVGPKSDRVRPTGAKVREALFSMIGDLRDTVVVDAFAGTGALGLEALSRGARLCYFFDPSREAISIIKENIARVGVEDRAKLYRCDFERGLKEIVEGTPDLWFFDPPYGTSLAERGLRAMASAPDIVTPGALVVWESSTSEELFEIEQFEIAEQREYGTTRLIFFRRLEAADEDADIQ